MKILNNRVKKPPRVKNGIQLAIRHNMQLFEHKNKNKTYQKNVTNVVNAK